MNSTSTRLSNALTAYLDFERPHVLRAEVQEAIRDTVGAIYDGKRDDAEAKPVLDLLGKASVKLSKIEAGQTGPRTFISAVKATGQAIVRLKQIGL